MDFKKHLTSTVAAGALLAFAAPVSSFAGEANLGNDKVNVTLGGRIHRSIVHVDDGYRDSVFQGSGISGNSELWLSGSGKVTENVTMGAYVRWDVPKQGSSWSFGSTTGAATSTNHANTHKYEYIYFKHGSMGTLSIGDMEPGADGAFNGHYGEFAGDAGTAAKDTDITTGSAGAFGGGEISDFIEALGPGADENNRVRYDFPEIAGLAVSADLEQDGGGSIGVFWSGSVSGLEAQASAGIENDGGGDELIGGSIALKHSSGLHAALNLSEKDVDVETTTATDVENVRVVAGYESNFSSLGTTNTSIRYLKVDDATGTGDEGKSISIGIHQSLDSVGGAIVLQYENLSFSDTAGTDMNDIDTVVLETSFNF